MGLAGIGLAEEHQPPLFVSECDPGALWCFCGATSLSPCPVQQCGQAWKSRWRGISQCPHVLLQDKHCRKMPGYYTDLEDSLINVPQSSSHCFSGRAAVLRASWRHVEGRSLRQLCNCWGLLWCSATLWYHQCLSVWLSPAGCAASPCTPVFLTHAHKEVPECARGKSHCHNFYSKYM